MRDDVDWKKLRKEYIESDISQAKLAAKYGVPDKTLRSRAQRERWSAQRAEFRANLSKKLAGVLSEEYFKKINLSAEKLLQELERARKDLQKTPVVTRETYVNEDGHRCFRQRVTFERGGKVNAGELQKLVGTLDKLLDIGRKQSGADDAVVTVEFREPDTEDLSV